MEERKRFAVVLSGCGVYDGADIHEATLAMFAIMKNGGTYKIFAPDINQVHVINHISGEVMKETRNVLIESARIARGDIQPLSEFVPQDFDALFFPGGFGAAKNLSSFAFDGVNMIVNPDVKKAVTEAVNNHLPIGAMCISPVIIARVIERPEITIGSDKDAIDALETMGAKHVESNHGEVIVDKKYKIATTPCYMLDANILQIAEGADNITKVLIDMM